MAGKGDRYRRVDREKWDRNYDYIFRRTKARVATRYPVPARFTKPEWAVDQLVRETGLMEDICKCGVGHPNRSWLDTFDPDGKRGWGIHGCCGCCLKGDNDAR